MLVRAFDFICIIFFGSLWVYIFSVYLRIREGVRNWNGGICRVCGLPIDRYYDEPKSSFDALVFCKQHHFVWITSVTFHKHRQMFKALW